MVVTVVVMVAKQLPLLLPKIQRLLQIILIFILDSPQKHHLLGLCTQPCLDLELALCNNRWQPTNHQEKLRERPQASLDKTCGMKHHYASKTL
jgi:hypothetical protein